MMKLDCPIPRCNDTGKLILRLTVGVLMLFHGVSKINGGIDGIGGMLSGAGLPAMVAYGVYVGELVAPAMVIAGWRARIGAALMAFNMVVAIGLAHMGQIFTVGQMGGYALELQMFFLLGSVAIFFLGAGSLALSKSNSWD